jgi:hypothetical protein
MTARSRAVLLLAVLLGLTPLITGCGLAGGIEHTTSNAASAPAQANPGETQGTIPVVAESAPARPSATAQQALTRYAALYINWTYRTLVARDAQLAAIAVSGARAVELQAAAQAKRDFALQRGRIYNRGVVVSVSQAIGGAPDEWVLVTREQTGGNQEYAGLQAAFHVTLATAQAVPGGWAVAEWHPQS